MADRRSDQDWWEGGLTPLDSRNPLYWVQGDPILGATCTGKNDPDALEVCEEERRIDWCMATLAETERAQHDGWIARWTMDGTLNGKQARVVHALLGRAVSP